MSRIQLDYSNALTEAVGAKGLELSRLAALAEASTSGLAAVQARRKTDLRWMDLPHEKAVHAELLACASELKGRFSDIVVLGIGGSALGTTAVQSAIAGALHNQVLTGVPAARPRLWVLDNIDPDHIGPFLASLDLKQTLFNVISKSGGTAETMSQFLIARGLLIDALGEAEHKDHLIITTDEKKGVLREIVQREGYRSFIVPDGVGGRFSVLSPVGLLPLAVAGVDIEALLAGAAEMDERCANAKWDENPALVYAALQYLFQVEQAMPISVTFSYSQRLAAMADWYAQLVAESIGKRVGKDGAEVFTGPTPVRAVGVTDQHSQVQLYVEGPFDKWFTLLAVDQIDGDVSIPRAYEDLEGVAYLGERTLGELFTAEREGTRIALTEAGRPNVSVHFPKVNEHTVGQYLQMMELAVAVMGEHYGVDAFDQPGVEAGKVAAYALMGRTGYEARRAEIEAAGQRSPRTV